MANVADILDFLNTVAPPYMKEEWDNVGLNCGRLDAEVNRILVALDPFDEAIDEAIGMGADLLVTHHVLIHSPGFITDGDIQGARVLSLIENHIAHINAHTNLDLAPGGVNDVLAQTLGLSDIEVLNPVGESEDGEPYGLLRAGNVEEMPLEDFMARVKEELGTPMLRFVDGGRPVCRVAVGGGSCGSALFEVAEAGCDTFVTADIKYNQFRDAMDLGINLIDAGHFYTENPVCYILVDKLREAFPDITVEISQNHADPMNFF